MRNKLLIQPVEEKVINLYAYTLPQVKDREGYIKVGDTERDVEDRIKEQTNTAGLTPDILWSKHAQKQDGTWFRDSQLHRFFELNGIQRENFGTTANEWFYFNDHPERAEELTDLYISQDYGQAQIADKNQDYTLRREQAEAVEETLSYYQSDQEPREFLWNAKPRFGKTLTSYDLVRQINAQNTLIVTNRPAIANSWFDDFHKFIAWQEPDLKFISETDALQGKAMSRDEFIEFSQKTPNARQLVFISLQDLKGAEFAGGLYPKLEWVGNLHWDLLIIDEAHEGVDTVKTDRAFDALDRDFTLHLSGTPFKAIADQKFSSEQIYNWSYVNEQEAKYTWEEKHTDSNPYANLPELNLFTYQMSQMIEEEVSQGKKINEDYNIDYAFDLNEFFKTDPAGKFLYEADVIKFLDNLSSGKYPFSEDEYKKDLNHTLWLLPRVASAKRMEYLLKRHPVFKDYEIVLAAGDGISLDSQEVESEIQEAATDSEANRKSYDKVKEAIANNEKTITLSVGQLTTGVTIPEWTAVVMLSQIKSPALYFQAAFRAQNPYEYDKDGKHYKKERAYVFDFAPERTLELYDKLAVNLSADQDRYTEEDRKERIKHLLNFFPVIGEDAEGSMKELDMADVLTIPNRIKSTEVVKRGFMSNLLFQNIGNIFSAPDEIRDILGKLEPEKNQRKQERRPVIDLKPLVDEEGEVDIPDELVNNQKEKIFGKKVVDTNRFSEEPEVNIMVRKVMLDLDEKQSFEKIQDNFDLNNNRKDKVRDQFKESLNEKIEKDHAEYKNSQENLKHEQESKAKQLEKETNEKISQTLDDQAVRQLLEEAEKEKQRLEEEYEESLQKSQEAFDAKIQTRIEETAEETVKQEIERVENSKKQEEERDVRDHLRGFTRTIPAFLMAYGDEDTRLANFEENIDPDTFLELTSITIEEFKKLRDGFEYEDDDGNQKRFEGFFNEAVFNASVKTFFQKKAELANYFDESLEEDIYDYIPPQETNQIFTPREIVVMMVDQLEEENPDIFSNPTITFMDPYTKSGLYLTEIIKRLDEGLANQIPDQVERIQHIMAKQVYGVAPTNIIFNIVKNYVLGIDLPITDHNIYQYDLTESSKNETMQEDLHQLLGGENVKFDVIIGNPPYQDKGIGETARDEPIYHYFIDNSYDLADKVSFITPARFLFNAGQTPKKWNEKMLNDPHLKVIYYEPDSNKVFNNTDIKGGVAVTYRDEKKILGPIKIFTTSTEINSILTKVEAISKESLNTILFGKSSYKFDLTLYQDFPGLLERVSSGERKSINSNIFEKFTEVFSDKNTNDSQVGILGRLNNNRVIKWIENRYIQPHPNLNSYKVILPASNGSGAFGETLSAPLIGKPLIGHTQTFISFGRFTDKNEANNCLKYIKTKFSRCMLGVMKVTQHNQSKEVWKYVPLQDFTKKSDIDWSKSITEIDQQLYAKYGLTQEEIDFIEENVQEME